jgi:aspartate carbamoyltransferase regulatory subunit
MSNGEMLTCGLCTNPIKDEELNQLRISNEEIKKIRNYQMKKTLDACSNDTRGIIKCPNQNCSWTTEAENLIEPFKVECPLCQRQFCSLCNQQYHYRTKCQQLPHITQQWYLWCQTGSNIFFIFI